MRPRSGRRRGALLVLAAIVALGSAAPADADADDGDGRLAGGRVLLVSVPDLTWADLDPGGTPNLWSVAADASVALLSTRTADDLDGPAAAYLTLGAGRRAGAAPGPPTGRADQVGDSVLVPDLARQVEWNDALRYGARPGALGAALAAAGASVSVVGDAAPTMASSDGRAVSLATTAPSGLTPGGRVDGLLLEAPDAPGGVRMDPAAVVDAVGLELGRSAVVVVELSDLQRAVRTTSSTDPDPAAAGLRRTDELFGDLVGLVDPSRDTVLVVGPTTPGEERRPGVFAWRGAGIGAGPVRSASTRREGYVALTDLASTVLHVVGADVPDEIADTPVIPRVVGDDADPQERLGRLVAAADRAVSRDATVGPVAVGIVLLAILSGLLGVWFVRSGRPAPTWVRVVCTTTMSLPVAAFLAGGRPGVGLGVPVVVGSTVLIALGTAVVAEWAAVRSGPDAAPLVPAGLTAVVLVVDVVAGGRLQIDTPLGYSATVAGRFTGLGNQAAAYLLAATLAVLASGWIHQSRRGRSDRSLLVGSVVVAVVVVVVTGAPWWGSDVGGVLTAIPALLTVVVVLRDRGEVRRRSVVVAGLGLIGAVLLLLVVGWWDRSRPPTSRTHLGRFVDDLVAGDAGPVIGRKLAASWDVLTSTPWTVVVPVLLVALASLAWMPGRRRWAVSTRQPALPAFGASVAVAGFVGWAVNDSGVAVAASMLAIAVPYVACVATSPSVAPPDDAGVASVGAGLTTENPA